MREHTASMSVTAPPDSTPWSTAARRYGVIRSAAYHSGHDPAGSLRIGARPIHASAGPSGGGAPNAGAPGAGSGPGAPPTPRAGAAGGGPGGTKPTRSHSSS